MALVSYFKGEPNDYVLAYKNGKVVRQGVGIAFWYYRPTTSIVVVPTSTIDALFALNETTHDFQQISIQGQVTYQIAKPETVAKLLDFTIEPRTRAYRSEDPTRLSQRILNVVQASGREELARMTLEEALRSSEKIGAAVLAKIKQEPLLEALGVACQSLFVTAIKPTPEIQKALEAEHREALNKRADQAIYSRRAEAVSQERRIKQNELQTSVELEEKRQQLVALQATNSRSEAEARAEAQRIELVPFQSCDPRLVLALAFRDFALRAEKIQNLHISPEILDQLLNRAHDQRPPDYRPHDHG